jgi:TRAP-type C4-dicarboxylate transport system permease large subunit
MGMAEQLLMAAAAGMAREGVVILAMGIGLFAPPFGVGYYAACAISRINPNDRLARNSARGAVPLP